MRNKILEIYCDECGNTEHYLIGTPNSILRENLWIVTGDKLDFCSKICYLTNKGKINTTKSEAKQQKYQK